MNAAREGPFAARVGRGELEEVEEVEASPVCCEMRPLSVGEACEMVEGRWRRSAVSGELWWLFLVP